MRNQMFSQKIKRESFQKKTAALLTVLLLFAMARVCFGAAGISQSWTEDENGTCIAYVRELPDVQEVSAMIGTKETGEVKASRLQDIQDFHMMTYILVDNSASINQADKDKIRQVIYTLVQNHLPGERFKFATFAEDITVINEFSEDYGAVLISVDNIEYKDRQTYVMKAVYQIFQELQADDGSHSYKRLLIFSDGGEGSTGGDYTLQEALDSLRNNPFPIYTMGCRWKNNQDVLDNFGALARQSGGSYFTLDDVLPENLNQIQDAMAQDYGAYRFDIPVPAEAQDGGEKSLELKIRTSQGDMTVRTTARMPQNSYVLATPEITITEKPATQTLAPGPSEAPKVSPLPTPTSLPTVTIPPEPEKNFFQKYWLVLLIVLLVLLGVIILIVASIRSRKKHHDRIIEEEVKRYVKGSSSDSGDATMLYREDEGTSTRSFDTDFESDETVKMFGMEREHEIYVRFVDINRSGVVYNAPLRGGSLVVGRNSSKSDLALQEDGTVSGRHFEITASGSRLYVEDLGSKNGTWVNRDRLHGKREIHGGDIIRAGDTELQVDISS